MKFKNKFYDSLDFTYNSKELSVLSNGEFYEFYYYLDEIVKKKFGGKLEELIIKNMTIKKDGKVILEGTIKNRKIRKFLSKITFWAY